MPPELLSPVLGMSNTEGQTQATVSVHQCPPLTM
jgi:hypothetical protein